MKKDVIIEGVNVNLDALKESNGKLEKTEIFSHLPEAKQAAAYAALQAEIDAHTPAPATVTVEKGKAVQEFASEATQGSPPESKKK